MATNKNAFIRYKTLDKCFSNSYRKYYIEDLINSCSNVLTEHYGKGITVSRRQIFIDIDFMKSNAGYEAPIESIKDGRKTFYRYEDLNFTILNKPLTKEEQLSIENTLELLSRIKGIRGLDTLGNTVAKLNNLKDSSDLTAEHIISFEENEFLNGIDLLIPLYNYIKNKQVLSVKYQSFKSDIIQEFIISVYHLKQYNNRWFLFGINHANHQILNLPLDRIKEIEIVNEVYIPSKIDFSEYFEDIIGVTNFLDSEIQVVKIKLMEDIIPYIKSKPIHGSQVIKDNILKIEVKLNYELEALVFSFGEKMTVLEPHTFKERIKERLKIMKENY